MTIATLPPRRAMRVVEALMFLQVMMTVWTGLRLRITLKESDSIIRCLGVQKVSKQDGKC